jgi:hypothetical protein
MKSRRATPARLNHLRETAESYSAVILWVAESMRIAGQRHPVNFEGWRPRTAHDTRFSSRNGGNPF